MNDDAKILPRMNDQQFKTAKALIKEVCCNYDSTTGSCLLLNRDEVVPCPQLIALSVCCKHFRDVLLEDPRGKELRAKIYRLDHWKVCPVCGGLFLATSNRAKYCAKCAKLIKNKQTAARMKRYRG